MKRKKSNNGKNTKTHVPSGSLASRSFNANNRHPDGKECSDPNCICKLDDFLLDCVVNASGCTEEKAEEILYTHFENHMNTTALDIVAHLSAMMAGWLLAKPMGMKIVSLAVEKDGYTSIFRLPPEDSEEPDSPGNGDKATS